MDIQKGDHVLVNVAPFIGSLMRGSESIPCEVLDVNGLQVFVRPNRRTAAPRCGSCQIGSMADNGSDASCSRR